MNKDRIMISREEVVRSTSHLFHPEDTLEDISISLARIADMLAEYNGYTIEYEKNTKCWRENNG